MLSGEVPFNSITTHRTAEDIVEDITRSKLSYDTTAWKNVSQAAKNLVKGLLTVDLSKRLSYASLHITKWFNEKKIKK
jgi:serine/threonine protein kinase